MGRSSITEKHEKAVKEIVFPAYKTIVFVPDQMGSDSILAEKVNQMSCFGYDYVDNIVKKSETILLFKFRNDNKL